MVYPHDEVGRSRTRRYWEERYRSGGKLWGEEAPPQALRAVDVLVAHRAEVVLDVGCGYGRDLALFEAAGLVAVGVDIATGGLCLARASCAAAQLVQGDATRLPFRDGSFDGVWSNIVLMLLPPVSAAVAAREMHRMLTSGGVVVVSTFSTADADFGKGECVGDNTYHYQGHTSHFSTSEELVGLFPGYRRLVLEEVTYRHPDPADGEHVHTLWFFAALKS